MHIFLEKKKKKERLWTVTIRGALGFLEQNYNVYLVAQSWVTQRGSTSPILSQFSRDQHARPLKEDFSVWDFYSTDATTSL